ncbi:prepilin-type N-terminal cleavage/methylation domain-containing protein [Kordiimonas aquimaris]|uniref:prepilin-type N-terminal cleavage/methylation domain-containing protein n=1 Tax=Kordiimonas aquimaris TaxID=707591 RepID=UPI0021CFFAD4|nr:prepilin-type N-terminal cleavage/methylation domain-containing protein [Kordiimonas aquimaris]
MKNWLHDKAPRSEAGFSLIELMVVMVIIGLMTSAAVILVPEQTPPLMESARKAATTMTALQRQSVMTGRVYAIDLRAGALDVRYQTQMGWAKASGVITENSIFLEAAEISLGGVRVTKAKTSNDFLPQLWFLPTGEFQSFQMVAETDSGQISLDAIAGQSIRVTSDAQ